MAAISITAANVIPSSAATSVTGVAGATITTGQLLYIDTTASNVLKLCDADASALAATVAGIARHGASAGQKITYITRDPALVLGATILAGDTLWASPTAGGITKTIGDLVSGNYVTSLGVMTSTTVCNFQITAGGLVV